MSLDAGVDLIVVPRDGGPSRTLHLEGRRFKLAVAALAALVVSLSLMVGSWWYLAARAARVDDLEAELVQFQEDRQRMAELAASLGALEARYEQLRAMFGPDVGAGTGLWLPPPAPAASNRTSGSGADGIPDAWPLAAEGFVTQGLLAGDGGDHPGVDIAVATDTYIRAAGAGQVLEVGEDAVYGHFVRLEHDGGYLTLYAHASSTLVEPGQTVRKGEVIALSGNSGRSTAPHLHFEIVRDGEAVDPLSLVRPPA